MIVVVCQLSAHEVVTSSQSARQLVISIPYVCSDVREWVERMVEKILPTFQATERDEVSIHTVSLLM